MPWLCKLKALMFVQKEKAYPYVRAYDGYKYALQYALLHASIYLAGSWSHGNPSQRERRPCGPCVQLYCIRMTVLCL